MKVLDGICGVATYFCSVVSCLHYRPVTSHIPADDSIPYSICHVSCSCSGFQSHEGNHRAVTNSATAHVPTHCYTDCRGEDYVTYKTETIYLYFLHHLMCKPLLNDMLNFIYVFLYACHDVRPSSLLHEHSFISCHDKMSSPLLHEHSFIFCHDIMSNPLLHEPSFIFCHDIMSNSLLHKHSFIFCHDIMSSPLLHEHSFISCPFNQLIVNNLK